MTTIPSFVKTVLLCFSIVAACAAHATNDYPSRTAKVIVAYAPGGTADLLGRIMAQQLTQDLKQTFIVENRPGAGGNIGTSIIAKSKPDGYTIGIGSAGSLAVNYATYKNMPYNSEEDFSYIGIIAAVPNVLVVNGDSSIKNVAQLINYLKEHKKAFFSSSGVGNQPHLLGELFKQRIGLPELTNIPYQGSAPATTALLSNQVSFMFNDLLGVLPFIQSGKLRALAVTRGQRLSILPDVPTMQEQGIQDFNIDTWFSLVGPARMDENAQKTLERLFTSYKNNEKLQKRIKDLGAFPVFSDGKTLQNKIIVARKKWTDVAKTAHLESR